MTDMRRITIYTSERTRWEGKLPSDFITAFLRERKIAARFLAWHAQAGMYEDGEIVSSKIEVISGNQPVKMEILLPAEQAAEVSGELRTLLCDCVLWLEDLPGAVKLGKASAGGRPRLVGDVMTAEPKTVQLDTPVIDVVQLLLREEFHAVPVVDEFGIIKGIITQNDLISRSRMPVRLGLLHALASDAEALKWAQGRTAAEVMTAEVETARAQEPLAEVVHRMLRKNLKRLPVVNEFNKVVGMLARYDILRAESKEVGGGETILAGRALATPLRTAKEAARLTIPAVRPDTGFQEILKVIDQNRVQRLAVTEEDGTFIGMIFDQDLIAAFDVEKNRVLRFFEEKIWRNPSAAIAKKCARELMRKQIATVQEDLPVEEAMKMMAERGYKRVPVVDKDGKFRGMLSRDSLLRSTYY